VTSRKRLAPSAHWAAAEPVPARVRRRWARVSLVEMKPKLLADGMPAVSLPGSGRKSTRRRRAEDFQLDLPDGSAVRVEGWVRDKRFTQDVRVALPDGRAICAEGFREGVVRVGGGQSPQLRRWRLHRLFRLGHRYVAGLA
jgi:hypothetical protein